MFFFFFSNNFLLFKSWCTDEEMKGPIVLLAVPLPLSCSGTQSLRENQHDLECDEEKTTSPIKEFV